jgi:hypothetical protein
MCLARPKAPSVSQSIYALAAAATVRQPMRACMLASRQPARQPVRDTIFLPQKQIAGSPSRLAPEFPARRVPSLRDAHLRPLRSMGAGANGPTRSSTLERAGRSWPSCIRRVFVGSDGGQKHGVWSMRKEELSMIGGTRQRLSLLASPERSRNGRAETAEDSAILRSRPEEPSPEVSPTLPILSNA